MSDIGSGCSRLAPAKINLSLQILGRRADGYHELQGLVAFADHGDRLSARLLDNQTHENEDWALCLEGTFGQQLQTAGALQSDNLVLQAARLYGDQHHSIRRGALCRGTFTLQKELPIAAGLGGGSSDAAAALLLLQQLCLEPIAKSTLFEIAVKLGADVAMCLVPSAQMIAGIGDVRQLVETFAPLAAVLVNPGVGVSTAAVFDGLGALDFGGDEVPQPPVVPDLSTFEKLLEYVRSQQNDLQEPAIRIAPVIADVLELLERDDSCRLSRMSGSGATCFGLYDSMDAAKQAARRISTQHPAWWVVATMLR